MLYHILEKLKQEMGSDFPKSLMIHANNCSVQNKNRYVLAFCSWLVHAKIFGKVHLRFLIADHTKNECDGAFRYIKRNMLCAADWRIIRESSVSTLSASATELYWMKCKNFLPQFYSIPRKMKNLLTINLNLFEGVIMVYCLRKRYHQIYFGMSGH